MLNILSMNNGKNIFLKMWRVIKALFYQQRRNVDFFGHE